VSIHGSADVDGNVMMSPGNPGARSTHPPFGPALIVDMKKESPPNTLRDNDLRNPPSIFEVSTTPEDIATIAPASS
jgi:hypothetical protein